MHIISVQGSQTQKLGEQKRQKFTRFLVIQVTDLGYQQASCQCEKRLRVVRDPESDDGEFEILLKDDWYDLDIMSGKPYRYSPHLASDTHSFL